MLVATLLALVALQEAHEAELKKAMEILSVDLLKKYVEHLASDDLEGRETGTKGNDMAAAFIGGEFKAAGLKPVGDEKTYFQAFSARGRPTQNVVGLWEGSDPKLKEQIVVVGGHYDHLGLQTEGEDKIRNGADDNASGSSTVTALARAFGGSGLRPRRSILFMGFSGEEMGLLGSHHYVRNPLFPKERHAAMLNLDMVGRNPDMPVAIYGMGTAREGALEEIVKTAVKRTGLKANINAGSTLGFGSSDHDSFRSAGIPAMFFFTNPHPDYHKPGDHADKIAYERMEQIGETALLVLVGLADREKDFVFKGPQQLGVTLLALDDVQLVEAGLPGDQGAVGVASVAEGSVGSKGGVKGGDWILSLHGKSIPRTPQAEGTLRRAIEKAPAGQDVSVVVWRDGKRVDLKVRWEE